MYRVSAILSSIETKLSPPRFNLLKTIWLNFRTLPFRKACKLPIFLYGAWNLRSLQGNIIINSDRVSSGMIKLGLNWAGYVTTSSSTLTLLANSKMVINERVRISQGVQICLYQNSELYLGYNSHLGDGVKVICAKKITIEQNSEITWECQILDHGSHYILDKGNGQVRRIIKPVKISSNCWIGNRSTIMPGTSLPSNSIVASNSLLNKDYISMGIKEYTLMGGIPARVLKENVMRIYNRDNEFYCHQYFNDTCSEVLSAPFSMLHHEEITRCKLC